jgi:hypothetical protein
MNDEQTEQFDLMRERQWELSERRARRSRTYETFLWTTAVVLGTVALWILAH